jgi:peptide/nickel transport system permease protein
MGSYLIKRVLLIIPTLFLASVLVFLMVRLIPGSVVDIMMSNVIGGTVDRAQIEQKLGLDKPIQVQYINWISKIITHGDLGTSVWSDRPVMEEIRARLPVTVELGLMAFIISLVIALPIGIYSALRQNTIGDLLGRSLAIFSLSVPAFWLATMVMVFPAIWWNWSPPMKYISLVEDPWSNLKQFLLPAFLTSLSMAGTLMRIIRTSLLDVLRQDYVRTAWAKGLKERVIIFRHVMKNGMIPVVTVLSGSIGLIIGGVVIIEQIFALPGMGRLFLDAVYLRDYPYVQGLNLFFAAITLVVILITDISYSWLDPRIRYK